MPFTDAQRKRLKAAGFNTADLKDIEKNLEEEEEAPSRRQRRVFVLDGREADSFLASLGVGGDDEEEEEEETPKRKKVKAVDDEEEEEEEPEEDERPPAGVKYFRG